VEKIGLLLDCLQPPIPRSVYDNVVKFPDIMHLMDTLKERKIARVKIGADGIAKYGETTQAIRNVNNTNLQVSSVH
jgi:phosphoinositide-3-kinase, regulatory subunit 4